MKRMAHVMRDELKTMSSQLVNSILSSQCSAHLCQFKWDKLLQELSLNAPVYLSMLISLTQTRQPRLNRLAVIGMSSAILLKLHLSKMSAVQKLISQYCMLDTVESAYNWAIMLLLCLYVHVRFSFC